MNDTESMLLAEIRTQAGSRSRVDYALLCRAFGQVFPAVTGHDQRRRLHTLLYALRAEGALTLPAGRMHYDRTTDPAMPAWANLTGPRAAPARPAQEPATFPWAPELRFAADIRSPQQLDVLRRVHEFLAGGGAARCLVPIKERSVELFGDEKRLDDLRAGSLFRSGRLSLPLLRCFQVSPPLVWERGSSQAELPVIVVENHCTYHSFVRWNSDHAAWAAVCYGNGDCFESSAPSLSSVVARISWDGRLLYFGDLDPKGLLIPLRVSKTLTAAGLPPVAPHQVCYARLLMRAQSVSLPVGQPLHFSDESADWLGPHLATQVRSWFENGTRLPQELVGYEQLQDLGHALTSA